LEGKRLVEGRGKIPRREKEVHLNLLEFGEKGKHLN